MIIGVPKEIKAQENRVGAVPAMVLDLVGAGNTVLIQQGAGLGAGISDEAYTKVGATLVANAASLDVVAPDLEGTLTVQRPDRAPFVFGHVRPPAQLSIVVED